MYVHKIFYLVTFTFQLIPFIIVASYGKPGGSYSYPVPTPSAAPALLPNLITPSPSAAPLLFNLQSPIASVAPQVFNLPSPSASLAPSAIHLPQPIPSIAPSLLVENVIGAGQYGPPVVNIGAQPLRLQLFGLHSLGLQSSSVGLSQPQFGQGLNLAQPGINFGAQLLPIGSPQLPLSSFQIPVAPTPDLGPTAAPLDVGPTVSPDIDVRGPGVHNTDEVVQKHVYVYVAPEEPEERPPPRQIVVPPPQRHYKIIFIKAPTPPAPTAPIIPPQVYNEEKTLVYVLVKKSEEEPDIKIQTPPPAPPSKPEVYFIRYGTRKESIGGGTVSSAPVPIGGGSGALPLVEDVSKVNDATVPTVRIGGESGLHTSVDTGLHTSVALDLNKASLNGGSALSLAVTAPPLENTLHVSSTPPNYNLPEHK